MFRNSGSKLKTAATGLTVLGVVAAVIIGAAVVYNDPGRGFLTGPLITVAVLLISWLWGLSLHAAGQAAESAERCEAMLRQMMQRLEEKEDAAANGGAETVECCAGLQPVEVAAEEDEG